jgi:pseudouridine synthase
MVQEGRVSVNGQTLDGLPAWVNPETDDVRVDGKRIESRERHVYVMLFKPKSVLSTNSDPEGRTLAIQLVEHPSKARLFPVGRLDIDSSGLLLLTNDGELTNRLTHPRFQMHKGYEVTVGGKVTDADLRELERVVGGVKQAGGEGGASLTVLKRDAGKSILYMELRESANSQIRQRLAHVGYPVKKLRRVRIGPLQLKGLQIGEWRDLTPIELRTLREHAFATPQQRAARTHESPKRTTAARRGPRTARAPRAPKR